MKFRMLLMLFVCACPFLVNAQMVAGGYVPVINTVECNRDNGRTQLTVNNNTGNYTINIYLSGEDEAQVGLKIVGDRPDHGMEWVRSDAHGIITVNVTQTSASLNLQMELDTEDVGACSIIPSM